MVPEFWRYRVMHYRGSRIPVIRRNSRVKCTEQMAAASKKSIPTRSWCASPYHKGPRWLLSVYFYRNKRQNTGLQSYCMTCTKIHMKPENQSQRVKDYRKRYTREYKEAQRRAKGVPTRNLVNPKFRGGKLDAYLKRFLTVQEVVENGSGNLITYLNGIPLSPSDERQLRRLKDVTRVRLQTADRIATKYQLPLWEMIEEAGCYKKDKRSIRHQ